MNFKHINFFDFVKLLIYLLICLSYFYFSRYPGNLEKEDKEHREQYLFMIPLLL